MFSGYTGKRIRSGWNTYVETMAAKLDMTDWVHLHRRRKWRLAGSLARCDDARWSRQILEFKPDFGCGRSVGRPKRRWADQLEAFA